MKASKTYRIVKPGEVYPVTFFAGDDLPEWAQVQAVADGAAVSDVLTVSRASTAVKVSADRPSSASAPVPIAALVAKTTRKAEIDVDGKLTKFGKGVTVYGQIARRLIDGGDAVEVRASEGAPEAK